MAKRKRKRKRKGGKQNGGGKFDIKTKASGGGILNNARTGFTSLIGNNSVVRGGEIKPYSPESTLGGSSLQMGGSKEEHVDSIEVPSHVSRKDGEIVAKAVGALQQSDADSQYDNNVPKHSPFSLLKNDAKDFVGNVVESISPSSLESSSFQNGGKKRRTRKKKRRKRRKSMRKRRKSMRKSKKRRKRNKKRKKTRKMKLRFSQRPPLKL